MNKHKKLLVLLIVFCLMLSACGGNDSPAQSDSSETAGKDDSINNTPAEIIDYAASVVLNMGSSTAKEEVTVKTFVDGDTVHFYVPTDVISTGVLKARFLAVDTPESTGKIEEYGKKASAFTKEKLSAATSIIIESEDGTWNPDSTGSRYLAWIWYKTADMTEYRNLNIELLQNGLAIANKSSQNKYGSVCISAINQAKAQKLNIYSGEPDPEFYYGDAVELTLKELRTNIEAYNGIKVAFNGIVTSNSGNQGVYVEDYDPETDMYYGMYIYYGFNISGTGLDILSVGNEVRIVGSLQYYETGGTWQVSDLTYRLMKPDDPGNIQKISDGNNAAYVTTSAEVFTSEKVTIDVNDAPVTFDYAELAMGSTIEMKGLKVVNVSTTTKEDSASNGAMTLTCEVDGYTVHVRTTVLYDENGQLITEDAYAGKTIDVKGIIDYFSGTYQIKVFSPDNITIIN